MWIMTTSITGSPILINTANVAVAEEFGNGVTNVTIRDGTVHMISMDFNKFASDVQKADVIRHG